MRLGHRVQALQHDGSRWQVDGEAFHAVVLACSAAEAARLAQDHAPEWAAQTRALRYEPIVTVWVQADGVQLPSPMMALVSSPQAPAQFVFDHGPLCGTPGRLAFVISGAQAWVDQGLQATADAVLQQAQTCFSAAWQTAARAMSLEDGRVTASRCAPRVLHVGAEKRATFRCTPALQRPATQVPCSALPGQGTGALLLAAGDYVAGPYPATLEGAVRSGEAAIAAITAITGIQTKATAGTR